MKTTTPTKSLSDNLNVSKSIRDKRNALAKKAEDGAYAKSGKKRKVVLKHVRGMDFEFNSKTEDKRPLPDTVQIAVPIEELPDELELDAQCRKRHKHGQTLLHYVYEEVHGVGKCCVFVFDARNTLAGKTFTEALMAMNNWLSIDVCKYESDVSHEIYLITHYSNAEWSCIAPHKDDLTLLKKLQGDDSESYRPDLAVMPIQNRGVVKNLHLNYRENINYHIHDTSLLLGGGTLKKAGARIGLCKHASPDFDVYPFSKWLEEDPESALAYAARDAAITLLVHQDFHRSRDSIIHRMCNDGVLDSSNKEIRKLLDGFSITAAGISDRLLKGFLEGKGVWERYRSAAAGIYEAYLTSNALVAKGGLNKYFSSDRPGYYRHVDILDVMSQYPTAMKMLKIPLVEPKRVELIDCSLTKSVAFVAKKLRQKLKDKHVAMLTLDFEYPPNTDEHHRTVVAKDYYTNDGCTVRKAKNQSITHWELFLMAHVTPDSKVRVKDCLIFECNEEGVDYCTIKEFVQYLLDERNKEKKVIKEWEVIASQRDLTEDEQNQLQGAKSRSESLKLVANGLAGKFAQKKMGYDTDSLNHTLMQGGTPSKTANGKVFESKISHVMIFNWITAMSRCFTAYAAWLNKAVMVVTDSMVIPTGQFKDPALHLTEYPQLNELLTTFKFDVDQTDIDIFIVKEREYFGIKPEDEETGELIKGNLELGVMQVARSKYKVAKLAIRGIRPKAGMSKEESSKAQLEESALRYKGYPLVTTEKGLVKFNEYLKGEILNSECKKTISRGSYNPRYMCDSLDALAYENKLKQKAKKEGYIDWLHMEVENPELAKKIRSESKSKTPKKIKFPLEVRQILAILHREDPDIHSLRNLERLTEKLGMRIAKSNIARWIGEIDEAVAWDVLKKAHGFPNGTDFSEKSKWLEKLESSLAKYFKVF